MCLLRHLRTLIVILLHSRPRILFLSSRILVLLSFSRILGLLSSRPLVLSPSRILVILVILLHSRPRHPLALSSSSSSSSSLILVILSDSRPLVVLSDSRPPAFLSSRPLVILAPPHSRPLLVLFSSSRPLLILSSSSRPLVLFSVLSDSRPPAFSSFLGFLDSCPLGFLSLVSSSCSLAMSSPIVQPLALPSSISTSHTAVNCSATGISHSLLF
jgi:hypothetical protein